MQVLLYGGSGNVGRAIAAELQARGHDVVAATRSGAPIEGLDVPVVVSDATDAQSVASSSSGFDAVISAVGPRHGTDDPESLVRAAHGLIEGLRRSGVKRLLVVGGAGSLEVAPGVRLIDTPEFPADWKPSALATAAALDVYRGADDLAWTYVSPAALLGPGERRAVYRRGGDQLLVDDAGKSEISYADYALGLVDELENGTAIGRRITLAY
jgi:putative NADH-flavin reductase